MVKQEDIARILKVSKSTVSRALNDLDVSKKTKLAVRKVAEELGYEQNILASSLANKKQKKVLAFLTTSIVHGYAEAMELGINRFLQDKKSYKFNIEMFYTDRNLHAKPRAEQYNSLLSNINDQADGVILSPLCRENIELAQKLCDEREIPLMTLDMAYDMHGLCHVGPDYVRVGKITANLMCSLLRYSGNVLVLLYDEGNNLANSKIRGFQEIADEYPGMNYVIKKIKAIDYNTYEAAIKEALSQQEFQGIYAPYNTEFVAEFLLKEGIKDKIVIANDRSPAINNHVKSGNIEAIVHQKPFYQGWTISSCFFSYFCNNREFIPGRKDTGIDILFKESLYWIENQVNDKEL